MEGLLRVDKRELHFWCFAKKAGSLKKELIKKQIYKSRDLAKAAINDYIETFYNRSRRHSHLGGVSPEQFEAVHKCRNKRVH